MKNDSYRISKYSVYIILLGILFISLNLPSPEVTKAFVVLEISIGSFTITRLTLYLLLFLCIIFFIRNSHKIVLEKVDICFYILTLIIFLSVYQDLTSFSKLIYFFSAVYVSYIIGRITGLNTPTKRVVFFVEITTLVQVLLVLYSVFISPFGFEGVEGRDLFRSFNNKIDGVEFSTRVTGTIGHPVVLASFLTPGAVAFLIKSIAPGKHRLLNLFFFLITFYVIFLTSSRGTWATLLILIVYLSLKYKLFKKVINVVIFTILISYILLGPFFEYIIGRLSLTTMSDGSVSHRLYMYYWSINQFINNPTLLLTGGGIGSVYSLLKSNPPPDHFLVVDNIYLTLFVETGLIGLVSFLLIILFVLRIKPISDELFTIKIMIIALMINGLTYDSFYWEQISIVFWVLVGFLISNNNNRYKYGGENK